ncbi:MAG: 2OG-Fe(II) oxygenase [Ilumatobacteraceae bacterium]
MTESTTTTFTFDEARLMELAQRLHAGFASAQPFPSVVIDDFVPPEVLDAVLCEFPEPEAARWQEFDKATEVKLALADTSQMGPVTRNLLAQFNSHAFVCFLEALTGISGLIPDPHYGGGGLHQIRAGGFLKIHADFNRNERLQLDRRLNVLLYLNKDWDDSYGGHLELWDQQMSGAVQRLLPAFNRMVCFATTSTAYHGHPEPLTCPADRARRSLALYYYTNGRPESEKGAAHSTLFQQRPGEQFKPSWKQRLKRWIPPVLTDLRSSKR